MDFSISAEQQQWYDDALAFARDALQDDVVSRDQAGEFSQELWRRCAEHGVLGWGVPEEHGGAGQDLITVMLGMEALGRGCRDNGLTFGLGTQMWGIQTGLLHFGTPEQIAHYLPGSMRGERIGAFSMTEECSGSDAFGLESTAVRDGDHYVLNGEKVLITLAPIADFAIVFARTDPAAGRWGLSTFLVDADTPGYTAQPVEAKMGLRTVPVGRITLENCRVPCANRLGKEGAGANLFQYSQGWERSLVLAPQLGAMHRQLDECVDFARQRKRQEIPIGKHQAVSHRIADMKLRLESARLVLHKTAWLTDQGRPNVMETALAKTVLAEAFAASSRDAIAIHGGTGYLTASGVERDLRDSLGATIYGGTVDVQRNIIAGLLGL